jgi:hypothetical protein
MQRRQLLGAAAEARKAGMTEADIDAGLAEYNTERRT